MRVFHKLATLGMLSLLVVGTVGCVNRLSANISPGVDLKARRTFFVVKHANDSNDVAELIQKKLVATGYQATVGAEGAPRPADADVVVVYTDKWMWDITMYMMELTITFRDPQNDFPIASGNALHGSLTRRSPEEMVDEVLGEIFKSAGSA